MFDISIMFTIREQTGSSEPMKEREIISYIINHINELVDIPDIKIIPFTRSFDGLKRDVFTDLALNLIFGKKSIKLICEVLSQIRPFKLEKIISNLKKRINKSENSLPVLLSTFTSKTIRNQCHSSGIGYIDCSGNIFISAPGLLISKETDKNRFPEKMKGAMYFNDRASIVLKKMLMENKRLWKIRTLHDETGISIGYISEVFKSLENSAFLVRKKKEGAKLTRIGELLSEWIGYYRFERQNRIVPYYSEHSNREGMMELIANALDNIPSQKYCYTLHAAGSFLAPWTSYESVHLYVDGPLQIWENALGLIPAKKEANLFLVQPYYKTSVFFDIQNIGPFVRTVSDIQLFLDLYNFPVRGREAAEHLFEKRLKNKLGLSEMP